MKSRLSKITISTIVSMFLILSQFSPAMAVTTQEEISPPDTNPVIEEGLDYLQTQVNMDGGVRWMDETSSVSVTIKVVQGLSAAGYSQDRLVSPSGNRPIDFLAQAGDDWVNEVESETPGYSVARAGQLLTAVAAADQNPHKFGVNETDLLFDLKASYDFSTGIYGASTPDNVTDQIWAMIGLAATNEAIPADAASWLAESQLEDGSWNDGWGSFLDTTPLALLALLASEYPELGEDVYPSGFGFMMENQQPTGGWRTEWDTTNNTNITAAVLQAISALDTSPVGEAWQKETGNPVTALMERQQEDGAIGGDFANAYATADAIIGLSSRAITQLGTLKSASKAFHVIFAAQEADGGWGSVGQTVDALLAIRAAGWNPNTVTTDSAYPREYLEANFNEYLQSGPDAIGKTILGVTVAGADPNDFAGVDLTESLMATYDETAGAFGTVDNTWHQALAILGLYAAQSEIPEGAIDTLLSLQQADGGWEYAAGFGTWPDNTALAIQALLAAGASPKDTAITSAVEHLRSTQTDDGGWGDASTTAYVLTALNALDEPLDDWQTDSFGTPNVNLRSYQKTNGSYLLSWTHPDDSLMATASALYALMGGDYLIQTMDDDSTATAGLIIDPGIEENGKPVTACVPLTATQTSGFDLLDASGLAYKAPDGFISSIMDVANADGETNYWSYWRWDGREWQFNNVGASESDVLPGTVEAWYFTSWESFPSLPPTFLPDLNTICEQPFLKSFPSMPYLSYLDVFADEPSTAEPDVQPEPMIEATEAEPINAVDEPAASETTSTPVENVEEARSPLPLIIIGVVGLVVIIMIIVLVVRKKK